MVAAGGVKETYILQAPVRINVPGQVDLIAIQVNPDYFGIREHTGERKSGRSGSTAKVKKTFSAELERHEITEQLAPQSVLHITGVFVTSDHVTEPGKGGPLGDMANQFQWPGRTTRLSGNVQIASPGEKGNFGGVQFRAAADLYDAVIARDLNG